MSHSECSTLATIAVGGDQIIRRNAVRRFLNDGYAAELRGKVPASRLFDEYQDWSRREQRPALDLRQFPQTVESLGFVRKHTATGNVFVGLRDRLPDDLMPFPDSAFEPEPIDDDDDWSFDLTFYPCVYWGTVAAEIRRDARRLRQQEDYDNADRDLWGYRRTTADEDRPSARLECISFLMGHILHGKNSWSPLSAVELAWLRELRQEADGILNPPVVYDIVIDLSGFDPSDVPARRRRALPAPATPARSDGFTIDASGWASA